MQCLCGLAASGGKPEFTKPLDSYGEGTIAVSDQEKSLFFQYIVEPSAEAGVDAASKLEANFARVVQDITNTGSTNIDGKVLTQQTLQRVDPNQISCVNAMVSAACCRLRGKQTSGPSTREDALVWAAAARFLSSRVQGSPEEMPGRQADMSSASAAALRMVLAQIEAASLLTSNRDTVIRDITNPGPCGVKGGQLSQPGMKRVDPKHQAAVGEMVKEVCGRLLGKSPQMEGVNSLSDPSAREKVLVWADAARFFGSRIQGSWDQCQGRKPDMSMGAATALRTMLGRLEAAHLLMSNSERVVQDIVNPGPNNIDGKTLTQVNLMRVEGRHKAAVNEMVKAVGRRLLGQEVSGPSAKDEALVWAQAAAFLSGRIQGSQEQMPGRAPDMSMNAALAMQKVLGQIEAANKLMSNRQKVVQDITNPGPSAVNGGMITQTNLKRLSRQHQASVDAMVGEVCGRLLGKKSESSVDAKVWGDAAVFLHQRIQAASGECPVRKPDMSVTAATALRTVLAQITK